MKTACACERVAFKYRRIRGKWSRLAQDCIGDVHCRMHHCMTCAPADEEAWLFVRDDLGRFLAA